MSNPVTVADNSTMDEQGINATLGTLTIGAKTLNVTGTGSGLNTPFFLTLGNTTLNASWNHGFAFWLYGVCGIAAAFVVMRFIPETRGVDTDMLAALWRREEKMGTAPTS